MENKNKDKKKRNKIIIIVIIIILLLLMLIKLYFEFRAERQRYEEFNKERNRIALEEESRKSLIDSLCNVYPDECENFEKYGNVGNLMNYANSLSDRNLADKKLLDSFIDSICAIDSVRCNEYRSWGAKNLDELKDFILADSINRKLIEDDEKAAAERARDEDRYLDSINNLRNKEIADSIAREKYLADSIAKADSAAKADSISRADSIAAENAKSSQTKDCRDTIAPWAYPEPTGGLYFEPIKVSFFVNEEGASVFYKYSKDAEFRQWNGEIISISQNTELYYYAVDSCENVFEEQKKVYEFRAKQAQNVCPDGMAQVESAQGNFCIDQYEWSNKKGVRPVNMVSQAQARDFCISVGKRLCTADEWTTACKGQHNWKYPYGNKYIKQACITQDTTYRRSEEAGECRGWYAIYDMTGNLAEWTSTRSEENNRFFIVKGGFWESGASATCEMSRYSYYPQNQHTPVGFRCCKSLEI